MYDATSDPPRWVRLVLGRPVSRESAVFLLMVSEVLTLLAAIMPIVAVIGGLRDGWASTWSSTETALLFLVAALLTLNVWMWQAIRWMDRYTMWPAHSPPVHG